MGWIIGNDVGMSSQTLWSVIMELEIPDYHPSIPYDLGDFGRCHRLLLLCDIETRNKALKETARKYKIWVPFEQNWENMTKLYITGEHEKLRELMKTLRPGV